MQKDLGSIPLRLSLIFSSCDFAPHGEWNIEMDLIAAHLNAE